MVERHNKRVEEVANALNAESKKKSKKSGVVGAPPSPVLASPPTGEFRRTADSSDYDANNRHRYSLVGNGLGATVWPDRQQGLDQLYNTLGMSAIRLWIDYRTGDPPACRDVTRGNMDSYWAGYGGDWAQQARTAAQNAANRGATVLIVVKKPPNKWMTPSSEVNGGSNMIDSPECDRAVGFFWGAAVKRFRDLGIPFQYIELFNEPECACPAIHFHAPMCQCMAGHSSCIV